MPLQSIVIVLITIALAVGCSEKPSAPPANVGAEDGSPRETAPKNDDTMSQPPDQRYAGPPVTVQVIRVDGVESVSTAIIDVTAPTGGWNFTVDDSKYLGDTVQIFMTLEGPGADEMVTQSLVPHQQQFTGDQPFTKAEVYIHMARRDIQTLTTNYRLAATGTAIN